MNQKGKYNARFDLSVIGLKNARQVNWNISPAELVEDTIKKGQGALSDTGALMIDTGEYTGRSPKDRFIVKDDQTEGTVDWGNVNIPFEPQKFDALQEKMLRFLEEKEIYCRDAYACAEESRRLNVRVVSEFSWQSLFVYNMFLRPNSEELNNFQAEWHVIAIPSFKADPKVDGTRQHNFVVINFTKKMILIGGTAYTGEIKKGIFSVLNYILPQDQGILSMHCSANVGENNDTAVFFGLSGTGKTTLSADPTRQLIGDDEHGWSGNKIFNFEGGCYAKCINLSPEGEPQIYNAIKFGALLENVRCHGSSRVVDYSNGEVTENTRVSYPIGYIENAKEPSVGNVPKNIFFLTCDAFGVLPPISKLTTGQAMYHFISGYTAKVAGTEAGITEPTTTFSACFGAPFLPLNPTQYAEMLGEKLEETGVNVWMVNTGWSGGPYGVGSRMKLSYTRAMVTAALNGDLDDVEFEELPIFGLNVPTECPIVPKNLLNPKSTWADPAAYNRKANQLAKSFVQNFEQFTDLANEEILAAAPRVLEGV